MAANIADWSKEIADFTYPIKFNLFKKINDNQGEHYEVTASYNKYKTDKDTTFGAFLNSMN